MGLLEKWKNRFAPGGGDRIVRTKTTYGQNLDRSVDMNGLITDIEDNFGSAANVSSNETNIATNTASITTINSLNPNSAKINVTAIGAKSAMNAQNLHLIGNVITIVPSPGAGKAIVPIALTITCKGGLITESSNKSLVFGYDFVLTGGQMGFSRVMGTVANSRFQTLMTSPSAASGNWIPKTDATDSPEDKPLIMWASGALNGNWTIEGGLVFWYEATCTDAGVWSV